MYLLIYINTHTYIYIIVDPAAGIEHILVGYHQPKIWIYEFWMERSVHTWQFQHQSQNLVI